MSRHRCQGSTCKRINKQRQVYGERETEACFQVSRYPVDVFCKMNQEVRLGLALEAVKGKEGFWLKMDD